MIESKSPEKAQLSTFAKVISGFAFKSQEFQETGIPVIKIKNIRLGSVDLSEIQFVPQKYQSIQPKYHVHGGDILISLTGSHISQPNSVVGRVARYPRGQETALLNQRAGKVLISDPNRCNPTFLYYHLLDDEVRRKIVSFAHGAANQANISPGQIESLDINLPPLPTQRKIASILSAYDDLIENNLRRIKILEEMAQALYREWFVKFRFPGHENVRMVDSQLGKIPEGWEVTRLTNVCHLVMGQSPKSEFYNTVGTGLPFHQGVSDFGERFPSDRMYCTVQNRVAEKGDVLFSVRAPVGRINVSDKQIVIGRGLSAIRHRTNYQWFLFHLLKERFKEEDTMGGGTIFKAVTKKDMEEIDFLVPNDGIVARFEEIVSPMEGEIENLTKRNSNLRQTCDLLLPRLISGELDVSDLDIDTSALDEQTDADSLGVPDTRPESKPITAAQVTEPDQANEPQPSEEEPPTLTKESQPISIDQWETNEILAVFRSVGRGRGFMERDEFIRQTARELGYQRVGTKIGSALKGHIMAALRRRVLEKNGDGLRVATPSIIDYETDELIQALCSITRKGQHLNREEAVREAAQYLGFQRVTGRVQITLKNAIRAAIRRGTFAGDREDIWRVD